MSFPPPITALKLCVSIGSNPPYEQDISTASMGSNSVQITDINGLLTAFNSEDVGTSFTPSLIATYNPRITLYLIFNFLFIGRKLKQYYFVNRQVDKQETNQYPSQPANQNSIWTTTTTPSTTSSIMADLT